MPPFPHCGCTCISGNILDKSLIFVHYTDLSFTLSYSLTRTSFHPLGWVSVPSAEVGPP